MFKNLSILQNLYFSLIFSFFCCVLFGSLQPVFASDEAMIDLSAMTWRFPYRKVDFFLLLTSVVTVLLLCLVLWLGPLPLSSPWALLVSSLCFMNLWFTILVTLSFLCNAAAWGFGGTRSRFLAPPLPFCPDSDAVLSARPLTLRRNSVTRPHRLAPADLLGGLVLLFCPGPDLRPEWFWRDKLHRVWSLGVEEVRLVERGREECLR